LNVLKGYLEGSTCLEKFIVQINWKGVSGINILIREMKRLIHEVTQAKDIMNL
jgi:hypothetical protein